MTAVALALSVALAAQAPATDPKAAELRQKLVISLEQVAGGLDGVMGYSVVDLTSGDRIERLPSAVFAAASSIKLAILYELFKQVDEGKLSLDTVRPLDRAQVVGGSGVLQELTAPSLSLRDYAILMVIVSDNTATNVLIDTVGLANVTSRMEALGLKATKLRRKMIDMAAARRGDENVSTPADLARLLEILYKGEGLRKQSQDALLAILKKDKPSALKRGVPSSVAVANKTGSLEGVQADAGIVYLQGRPYVLSVMTTYLKENAAGEAAITSASRAAFDYFNRLAKNSEYGRQIR